MALRRRHRQAAERKAMDQANIEEGSEDGVKASWIELNFKKRECVKFVPSLTHEGFQRCGCGRLMSAHKFLNFYEKPDFVNEVVTNVHHEVERPRKSTCSSDHPRFLSSSSYQHSSYDAKPSPRHRKGKKSHHDTREVSDGRWNVLQHTAALPTDAFGTLEYQGTGEGDKSQYVRLAHDTHPELVLRLLSEQWGLQKPKMVITVHGGVHNFQLQPKLQRVFCDGLIKAAKTTGAWIMLFGLNTGIGAIVGNALKEHKVKSRGKIYSIGVAPWGVVDNREDLIGSQAISSYQTMTNPLSKGAVLNAAHTHFLLVDNGTEGKYGSELKFRRRLERKLSLQQINQKHSRKVPVVCLVLEGGKNTINVVLESVRQSPPIPVIVIDGSGRAADLLAFAHQYADDDGTMMEELRLQFLITIQNTFACEREQAQFMFLTIMECVRRKDLITIFRLGQGQAKENDLDNAILTASLKAKRTSAPDMLSLALTWNRIDIATNQIFVYGQQWPVWSLEQAMMDALTQDRTDFVKLLMENGVSMHKFLTIPRLEELYNIKQIPIHLLYLLQDVKKNITFGCRFNLIEIGLVIESLMGGAYRCNYTRKRFRLYYASQDKNCVKKRSSFSKHLLPSTLSKIDTASSFREETTFLSKNDKDGVGGLQNQIAKDFQYPFHELMVWAVLMKRQKMALFMWQHGEEAVAKALVASKLYKAMAYEAADDELDLEEMEKLRQYSSEFGELATQLLEICYRADTDAAQHLLTYELKHWSRHTCLSLAIAAQHREFIAHPCCQLLLNDLWMGGLNVRKNSSLRVMLGLICPPSLIMLQFKSLEELKLMPQTMEEHMDERNDSSSISSSSSSSLSSSSTSSSSSSSTSGSITSGFQQKPEVVGRGVTGLDHNDQLPEDAYHVFMAQQRQLSVSKKIYEFYNAPITKFWLHTLCYVAFLIIFTCVVLVSMEPMPSVFEWIIISYIGTLTLEKIREIAASEPSGAFNKIKLWLGHFWHQFDAVLLLTFYTGFSLRMLQDDHLLKVARAFYCVNVSLWYIRLLNIFSVSKYLGPYVMMMGKMMVDLGTFIILLAVVLVSFGVTRQALLHPNETATWGIVRDVFLEPYFMLYGEVYATSIDPCSAENNATLCVVGSWIVPTAMTLYLLVANILLLNMLIAVFNNTFAKVKNISDKIWKFHRYGMIVEYEFRPMLPPPFIVLSYMVMLISICFKKRKKSIFNSDRGLKLFLDDEDVEKLHDFEEDCLDDLFRRKDAKKDHTNGADDRKISASRIERVLDYVDDSEEHHQLISSQLHSLEERLLKLEETNMRILQILPQIADIHVRSSDFSHSERNSDEASFAAMRERMKYRLHRIRQDSEMSTTSDWHPSNVLMRRFQSQATKTRERHASERYPQDKDIEFRLRKTNSTGNITSSRTHLAEVPMSSSNLATASSHNEGSTVAMTRLFPEPEQKSVSCQDLLIMKDRKVQLDDSPPIHDTVSMVSGSEFLPSDFVEEQTPNMPRSEFLSSNQLAQPEKILSPENSAKVHPEWNFCEATVSDVAKHFDISEKHGDTSGNESSCSSLTESDHNATSSAVTRRKKYANFFKRKQTANLPMLIINSPERGSQNKSLTPIKDGSPMIVKDTPKFKTGSSTYPSLNVINATPTSRHMTDGRQASSLKYQGTSFMSKNQSPSNLLSPSSFQANQSLYKSITDCIDTSKWHDLNSKSTRPPPTPFETWWNKPPTFITDRNSPNVPSERISQDEWEDEPDTRRYGWNRPRKGRRHRSRAYSNNSSSSIKSGPSRRARGVRKHRHKRKNKIHKRSSDKSEAEDIATTAATECQTLGPLKETSSTSLKLQDDNPVFIQLPSTSSTPIFNINNSNIRTDASRKRVDTNEQTQSFFTRYATISEENGASAQSSNDSNKNIERVNGQVEDTETEFSPLLC